MPSFKKAIKPIKSTLLPVGTSLYLPKNHTDIYKTNPALLRKPYKIFSTNT